MSKVINFLAYLFEQGYQYRSINFDHSAISSMHEREVSITIKGIFHERPPQPRYSHTWNVSTVTTYIESLGENDSLSLADLTQKTVMLFALTRSTDLSQLHLDFRRYLPEVVAFQPTKLAKQSRPNQTTGRIFFPAFLANELLCPVVTLQA